MTDQLRGKVRHAGFATYLRTGRFVVVDLRHPVETKFNPRHDPDEEKRWTVIEYEVNGARFDVQFTYPEQLDAAEHCSDRCSAAVRKRFGSKPMIYPLIPDEFREFKPQS